MKTINSIILTIVTALLTIFPWSGNLQGTYQQLTFPGRDVIVDSVIEAVKHKDVKAIEEMLSESSKKRSDDLSVEIKNLIDTVEGEIVNASLYGNGDGSDYSNYGVKKSNRTWKIKFETTEKTYVLYVNWIIVDSQNPENVGLSSMSLSDLNDNLLAEAY